MNKCTVCGAELTRDDIGLYRKLFDRRAQSFKCTGCCAEYLSVSKRFLEVKIAEYKEMGCTLF